MTTDYTNSNTRTKLEWLESVPEPSPKSKPAPTPSPTERETYERVNKGVENVRLGHIERHEPGR